MSAVLLALLALIAGLPSLFAAPGTVAGTPAPRRTAGERHVTPVVDVVATSRTASGQPMSSVAATGGSRATAALPGRPAGRAVAPPGGPPCPVPH